MTIAQRAVTGRAEPGRSGALADRFGRVGGGLRVSLTDRCNLRCGYCMPEEGLDWLAKPHLLTDDEVARLVQIAVERLGVTQVRFTGGEPLLRKGLVEIIARTAALCPGHGLRSRRTAWACPSGPTPCAWLAWTGST